MKKLLWILFAFAIATQAAALDSSKLAMPQLQPLPQEGEAAHLAAEFLTHYHYKTAPLDDAMSEKIFDRYLKSLDPEKVFFVQSDIDQFADAKTKLDDAIVKEDLNIPFIICHWLYFYSSISFSFM